MTKYLILIIFFILIGCSESPSESPVEFMENEISSIIVEKGQVRLESNKINTRYCLAGKPLSYKLYDIEERNSRVLILKKPPKERLEIFALTPEHHYWKDTLNPDSKALTFHFTDSRKGCLNGICITTLNLLNDKEFTNICNILGKEH